MLFVHFSFLKQVFQHLSEVFQPSSIYLKMRHLFTALAPRYFGSHLKFILKRQTLLSSLLRANPWVQKYSVPKICHQKRSSDNTSCKYSFLFFACAVQLLLLHFASAAERGTTLGLCQGSFQLKDKAFEHSSNWLKSRLLVVPYLPPPFSHWQ